MSLASGRWLARATAASSMVVILAACATVEQDAVQEPALAALVAICESEPAPVEVFEEDAQAYADDLGVTLEVARERLAFQGVDGLQDAGVAANPGLWAGAWLEHEPEFGYVLFYKGDPGDVADVQAVAADCSVPIIVRSGAQVSEIELLAATERLSASGRLEPPMPPLGMYPDVRSGAIVLSGPIDPGPEVLAEIRELAGVPVRYVEEPAPTTQ